MKIIAVEFLPLLIAICLVGRSSSTSFHHRSLSSDSLILKLRGGQHQSESPSNEDYTPNNVSPNGEAPMAALPPTPLTSSIPFEGSAPLSIVSPPPLPSTSTAQSKNILNFQERAPPAIVMLGFTYLLLRFFGEKGLIGLVLVIQCAMYSETCSAVEEFNKSNGEDLHGNQIVSFPIQKWWWFATALMMTSGSNLIPRLASVTVDQVNLLTCGMSIISLVGAGIQLAMISSPEADHIYRNFLVKASFCNFALLVLVGQSSFWIRTAHEFGIVWVLFPAFLVIVNDTMAYIFGVLLGKHKLLPRLSPKKTVEGFVGAGMSTLAVAVPLLKRMIGKDGATNLVRHGLILAMYVSLVSPFGGFLASAVKRAHGTKDFGTLIPGHGGVVDRFDCQVVTAPFVYFYLKNFLSAAGSNLQNNS